MTDRNVYAWCMNRPIGTLLLSLAMVLLGVIAYLRLSIAPLPEADFPTIQITAALPGASAQTMASSVATPLEVELSSISGITEMTSTSALSKVTLTLQFSLDKNIDTAAQEVQVAINTASARLPADMPSLPTWRKVNPADGAVMIIGAYSDTLSLIEVSDFAETVLSRRLSQLEGVGLINVIGQRRPAIRIQARPEVLAAAGVTLADIRTAVQQASVNLPKGALFGDHRTSNLEVNDQLFEPVEYENVIVTYRNGAAVRVRDLASVSMGSENDYTQSWPNGQSGVSLLIRRQPGANIVATADAIKNALPSLQAALPANMTLEVLNDRTRTIRSSLHEVQLTLVIAIILVIGVMALFLRQWSATLIVTTVLGVSLVSTCAVMYLAGFSLNNLTLVAIVIAVSFIVDDAIVVIENIHRHLELGEDKRTAALKGVSEIGFTVVSISVSLIAALIPLLFMGGVVGRLFREFALTLVAALVISVVVCLTLAPTLAALFMQAPKPHSHPDKGLFFWLSVRYEHALNWALGHQRCMLGIFLGSVMLSVASFTIIPKGFFPLQDTAFIMGFTQASADISYEEMVAKHKELEAIFSKDPAIITYNHAVGGSTTDSISNGRMWLVLNDPGERDETVSQVIDRLRPQLATVTGIRVSLRAVQDINLSAGQPRAQYQYVLLAQSSDELATWATALADRLRTSQLFRDVSHDLQLDANITRITLDRDEAARYGFTARDLDNALYDAFGQRQISEYQTEVNQYKVVLELSTAQRGNTESLSYLHLRSPLTGQMVPLLAFARIEPPTSGPVVINHNGMRPAANLSFNLAPGVALGEAVTVLQNMQRELGMPASVSGTFQGSAQAFQSSLASQPFLILAALIAVYIILGMLYESLVHPLTILSTLPSAGIGAVLLLWAWQLDFSIMALIGLILLIGIVKKNGILMIDFALQAQREHNLSAQEAIHRACLARFRPILMTTLAALFGAVPLMLAFGTGAELREPLGVVIVGGLMLSQVLTLLTTPVVFLALDRLFHRGKRQQEIGLQPAE
ncbi:Multidrug resistance protein MdtC [Pseudomonas fluorescens]|uniref:Multidrug resistance protein MdtC n=1 Tax=Pseudomonas fluorescens TaxID=294 RepID=A0A5E6VIC7_PSEFL|nr:efflux RND transporter permease subunit [Pseudomonas fluorescens]VVN17535.1 Multidrug resistance protein MdtC [Pseudomonas fluorescens]